MTDVHSDAVVFAERVLGLDPFAHTVEALRATVPVVSVVGGRRSAKTLTSQIKALHVVLTRRGAQVLVVGPNEASVRRYLAETAALIEGTEFGRGAIVDVEAMVLRFTSGSEIIGLTPTPGRARGYGARVWLVVWDECGYGPAATMSDLRYVLADHVAEGSQLWMVGSPWGGDEHPFKATWLLGVNGDPDVASFQWRTDQNPLLPPGWLARERERINAIEAAGELDGEWVGDGAQFFPRALLDSCMADIELPPLPHLYGPARGIAAWDWGVSYDQSALWVNFRTPVRTLNPDHDGRAVFVGHPFLYPAATPLVEVVDDAVRCPSPFMYWASETNGAGAMPSQELSRRIKQRKLRQGQHRHWLLTATTAAKKLASYALLRWLMERGQIVLPRHPQMLRQFAGLRYDTAGRVGSIEAGDAAVHDDVTDSAALSMLPVSIDGRVVCGMQELAADRAVPEAPMELLDVPTVTTGTGLVVYSRPVLQSVAGTEVSLPAGAGPRRYVSTEFDHVKEQVAAALTHDQQEHQ